MQKSKRRNLAGTLPRFLLFPILLFAGYAAFISGVGGDHWAVQTAWVVSLSYFLFLVGGSFHEAIHSTLFRSEFANRWYGRIIGWLILIPASVYRESHWRHHAALNTPKDYELWPYCDPTKSLTFRRIFAWIDIFGGIVTAPYIYGRVYFDSNSDLKPHVRREITLEYLGHIVGWTAVGGLLYWAHAEEMINLYEVRPILGLPLLIAPMMNTIRKMTEHLGMKSYDPIYGTRTVSGTNWLTRFSSYYNFDLPVHGPHHRAPKAHGEEIEKLVETMKEEKKSETSDTPKTPLFPTYLSAVLDMIPHLIKNPQVGKQSSDLQAG